MTGLFGRLTLRCRRRVFAGIDRPAPGAPGSWLLHILRPMGQQKPPGVACDKHDACPLCAPEASLLHGLVVRTILGIGRYPIGSDAITKAFVGVHRASRLDEAED